MNELLNVRIEIENVRSDQIQVAELDGVEAIGRLFEFQLTVVAIDTDGLDADALAGALAELVFERGGVEVRRIHGMIVNVRDQLDTETQHAHYRLVFAPRSFRLTMHETLDIFMDVTVPGIIQKKLELTGLAHDTDFQFRFRHRYAEREFVVQYKETDLAFVSRLCEHLGISFFFEHDNGRDVIVFTDSNAGFRPIVGSDSVAFRGRGERRDIFKLETSTRLIPAQYVVRDYNYRMPHVDLTSAVETKEGYGGRVIEYGAHFKTPQEGEHIAHIRAEEQESTRKVFLGESDLMSLGAGATCLVEGHPWGDLRILITEVTHRSRQTVFGASADTGRPYLNTFRAIEAGKTFRPARVTPKPKVQGVITGVVDSTVESPYAELDDEGRYRVQFLFDTSNPGEGQASRPVRMVQPHSGPGYGMHFPLRRGVEVLITCVDGDPDRPIIVGTVPNPRTASPVSAENAPRNIIRTGGGNEINIDDTEGSRRIKLTTPHSGTVFQLGAPNSPEEGAILETKGASSHLSMVASSFSMVKANLTSIRNFTSSGSISTVAEPPTPFASILTASEFAASALTITEAALDLKEAEWKKAEAELKLASIRAQNQADADVTALDTARTTTATAADALVPSSLAADHDLVIKRNAYKAAQTLYETKMRDLRKYQELLRDAGPDGHAGRSYTVEVTRLTAEVAAAKTDRDTKRTAFSTAAETYYNSLPAADKPAYATLRSSFATALAAEDAADTASGTSWDAAVAAKKAWSDKTAENESGSDAIEMKKHRKNIAIAKSTQALFSTVVEIIVLVKDWLEKKEDMEKKGAAAEAAAASGARSAVSPFAVTPASALASKTKMVLSGVAAAASAAAAAAPVGAVGGTAAAGAVAGTAAAAVLVGASIAAATSSAQPIRHTLGSKGDMLLYGESNLFTWGDKATHYGMQSITLAAGTERSLPVVLPPVAEVKGQLLLLSNDKAELAAKTQLMLSSKEIDVSAEKMTVTATDTTLALSAKTLASLASTTDGVSISAKTTVALNGTTSVTADAPAIKLNATTTAELLAGDWGIALATGDAGGVNVGRKNGWQLALDKDGATLGIADAADNKLKAAGTLMKFGAKTATINIDGPIDITGKPVTIQGTTKLELKAAEIHIGGAKFDAANFMVKGTIDPTLQLEFDAIALKLQAADAGAKLAAKANEAALKAQDTADKAKKAANDADVAARAAADVASRGLDRAKAAAENALTATLGAARATQTAQTAANRAAAAFVQAEQAALAAAAVQQVAQRRHWR